MRDFVQVPIRASISPSLPIHALKSEACNLKKVREDMIALYQFREDVVNTILREFHSPHVSPSKISYGLEESQIPTKLRYGIWTTISTLKKAGLLKVANLRALMLVEAFKKMRVKEDLKLEDLKMDKCDLFMAIDINWIEKCPVCNSRNDFIIVEEVPVMDGPTHLHVLYRCSRILCRERRNTKSFSVCFDHLRELPLTLPWICGLYNDRLERKRRGSQFHIITEDIQESCPKCGATDVCVWGFDKDKVNYECVKCHWKWTYTR